MQTKTKLPQFEGKLLVPKELRESFPQADILGGDYGKAVLEEYQARVKEDYSNNKNLNVLSYKDNSVKGSNPFAVVLVNQILRDSSLRTAVQSELEMILKENLFNLRGTYEDTGLVLRSETNPNEYLAKDLSKQLKERDKLQYPVLIHLKDLVLRNDTDSPLGLAFNIKDNAELVYDSILNHNSGNFSTEDINEKTGLPSKLGEGNRYFCTRNSGLSRLYLYNDLYANANDDDLANSYDIGRVVVVSAEGANFCEGKLNNYKSKIEAERQKYLQNLGVLRKQIDLELNQ